MGYALLCEPGISYRNTNVAHASNTVGNWKCVERSHFVWVWSEDMVSKSLPPIETIGVNQSYYSTLKRYIHVEIIHLLHFLHFLPFVNECIYTFIHLEIIHIFIYPSSFILIMGSIIFVNTEDKKNHYKKMNQDCT